MVRLPYLNRVQAGRALAESLAHYARHAEVLALALPRGGVPVAYEVSELLEIPLDLMLVRKLGVPGQQELAMGAIATGGARLINENVVEPLDISPEVIEDVVRRERAELDRRQREYRGDRPLPHVIGHTILLIDDGLATGASMRVAVAALRQQHPKRVVVAVPVGPPDTVELIRQEADEVICPATPEPFFGVGQWYLNFEQTTDDEIQDLLERAWQRQERLPRMAEGGR